MGVWVIASVLQSLLLLVSSLSPIIELEPNVVKRDNIKFLDINLGQLLGNNQVSNLAQPNQQPITASSNNYEPYSIIPYSLEESNPYYPVQEYTDHGDVSQQFGSIEVGREHYNDKDFHDPELFSNTIGYKEYGSQTSFNLEGPKQLEVIETKNYHKDVEPYDTHEYKKYHHKEEEEHAEIHYHQHKHLHKHKHKQKHKHNHKEEHKHEHDHKHQHKALHEHKHKQEHKHYHNSDHKHEHKSHHQHKHKQDHKHDHHHEHKHDHKNKEKHQHEGYHKHKHEEWSAHKHNHWDDHKHDHHHGHKHWNEHKHGHRNYHKHGHQHYENNNHYHSKHKLWH